MTRLKHIPKLAIVLLVLAMLGIAWHFGIFAQFREPRVLAQTLVDMGGWGYLAFIAAFTMLQPFGLPGTLFIVAASLIWPWQTAFVLAMVASMLATVVAFSFARFVARDWVSARIPERFRKYNDALEANAFQTIVFLRLIFWTSQPLTFFLAVSKVRFWMHLWASSLGYLLPWFLISYFGSEIFDESGKMQPGAWKMLGGLIVASVFIAVLARVYGRRRLSKL